MGRRRTWSQVAEAKLRKLYATTSLARLAFLLKRTEKAVRTRAKLLGVKRGKAKHWSAEEIRVLRARYRDEFTADIARDIGRLPPAVCRKAMALGLSKSREVLQAMGRIYSQHPKAVAARIKRGSVPPNKGLRRPGWYSGRMRETQFKKGRLAHEACNYVPIGTEKVDRKRKVLMRKMTDDPSLFPVSRWSPVHVLVWQAANGPIPAGHICIFKPGTKTFVANEITIDKLEVVSFAENMRRNTVHNLPAPLPQLVLLRGRLNRKLNRLERPHEKQD